MEEVIIKIWTIGEDVRKQIPSKLDFKASNITKNKEVTFYNDKRVSCSAWWKKLHIFIILYIYQII